MVSSSRKTMKSTSQDCSRGQVRRASWDYQGRAGAENFRNQAMHAQSHGLSEQQGCLSCQVQRRNGLSQSEGETRPGGQR